MSSQAARRSGAHDDPRAMGVTARLLCASPRLLQACGLGVGDGADDRNEDLNLTVGFDCHFARAVVGLAQHHAHFGADLGLGVDRARPRRVSPSCAGFGIYFAQRVATDELVSNFTNCP